MVNCGSAGGCAATATGGAAAIAAIGDDPMSNAASRRDGLGVMMGCPSLRLVDRRQRRLLPATSEVPRGIAFASRFGATIGHALDCVGRARDGKTAGASPILEF